MTYNVSKLFARAGGGMILCGLFFLPWYKFDLGQLGDMLGGGGTNSFKVAGLPTAQTFSAWDGGHTLFLIVAFFAVLAVTQVPFAAPGMVGRFFMFAGFAGVVLIAYKIVHPPMDFLSLLHLQLKPQPGIFVACVGMALIAYGGWEQVKRDLTQPLETQQFDSDWHMSEQPGVPNQGYAQQQGVAHMPRQAANPQPQLQPQVQAQQVAAQRAIPPDPFAPKPPTFQ